MMAGMKAVWMLLFAAAAHAQPERAVSESVADFRSVRDYIVRAAEKMPDAEYGFRPVAAVRTFGQQIADPFDVVRFGNTTRTKFSMLNWNVWHTWEHYGNIVVYLRVKTLVPPSSEKR
jgi:hypothetical protein